MKPARTAMLTAVLLVAACGQSSPVASHSSPTARASSGAARPSASSSASPAAVPTPTAPPGGWRLVIADYSKNQVRLARFDATDVAAVAGWFDGIVADHAIVISGQNVLAVSPSGTVSNLGRFDGIPENSGPGSIAVRPDLGEWIYTVTDTSLTSTILLGAPNGYQTLATIPSPDGNTFYQPFAWNAGGVYMVKEGTGLGGVGPFLEYHFPLAKFDLTTRQVTMITPECDAVAVLDDGTMLCRTRTGGLEVRPPSGPSHTVQIATSATGGGNGVYSRVMLSADRHRLVAARNGNANPDLVNFQMATGDLTGTSVSVFGPADYYPDAWLPDGRVVADHLCWTYQQNNGPCDASLDGTYFISADGQSKTLFFKLAQGAAVVGWL